MDVIQLTSTKEITADILNKNIKDLGYEEEWKTWKQGEDYPILDL